MIILIYRWTIYAKWVRCIIFELAWPPHYFYYCLSNLEGFGSSCSEYSKLFTYGSSNKLPTVNCFGRMRNAAKCLLWSLILYYNWRLAPISQFSILFILFYLGLLSLLNLIPFPEENLPYSQLRNPFTFIT